MRALRWLVDIWESLRDVMDREPYTVVAVILFVVVVLIGVDG